MKTDIILGGVGGQGILTIAMLVGRAAVASGLNVKQSEVHGMAQRGGAVFSHLRLSDTTIHSDLVPRGGADVVLGVEPMEALRYVEYLKPTGILLANSTPVVNIDLYPEAERLLADIRRRPRHVVVDADGIARNLGLPNAMNVVMLGTLAPFIGMPPDTLRAAICATFATKGAKVVEANLAAFAAGLKEAEGK